jgi:acyl phosphate:glycerol-3-phosphate acyltransferase
MALHIGLIILSFLVGYLAASFPSGVVIGKLFFKKDVRLLGSGGTGMTNVFRNFGRNAAITVFILDLAKSTLPVVFGASLAYTLTNVGQNDPFIGQSIIYVAGLGTTLGHCYPIFAQFKGGKAVSSAGSFVLMTNWILALVGISIMLIILKTKKIVSISSITGYFVTFVLSLFLFIEPLSTIGMWNHAQSGWFYSLAIFVLWLIILYRHKENIQRLIRGEELDFKKKKK